MTIKIDNLRGDVSIARIIGISPSGGFKVEPLEPTKYVDDGDAALYSFKEGVYRVKISTRAIEPDYQFYVISSQKEKPTKITVEEALSMFIK